MEPFQLSWSEALGAGSQGAVPHQPWRAGILGFREGEIKGSQEILLLISWMNTSHHGIDCTVGCCWLRERL